MTRFKLDFFWDVTVGAPPPKITCFHFHEDDSWHECIVIDLGEGQFKVECMDCHRQEKIRILT